MNSKKKPVLLFMLALICSIVLWPHTTYAATKAKTYTVLQGKSIIIKDTRKNITWKSKNTKIAKVNKNGKVTGVSLGDTKIIATDKNNKKITYIIKVSNYTIKSLKNKKTPNKVTIQTVNGNKTYTVYNQVGYSSAYLNRRGCSFCAISTVCSAYGKNISPLSIHTASVNKKYSERYAIKTTKSKTSVSNNRSLSVYSVSAILNNIGIKNHAVYKFTLNNAEKEITENLENGKPVVVICHNKKVNGIKLANSYHFIVLIGLDKDGNCIVLNPAGGSVNKSQCTGEYHIPVRTLIKNHMWSCTGNKYKSFNFYERKSYGGYIVMDK